MQISPPLEGKTLIPQARLCEMLGKTRSGLYRLINKDPDFPAPIKTGVCRRGRCYYVAEEINAWLRTQIERRDQV
ncbi:MAG TPA: transcriptional regulator [Pseudomonas sp.]|nr:transcriptional regulator [Pseudomonas sp.]